MKEANFSQLYLGCAEVVDDVADGLGGEELGMTALVAGIEGGNQRLTAAYPTVQAVECHMRVAVGKIELRQLALGVALDLEFCVHNCVCSFSLRIRNATLTPFGVRAFHGS